MFNGTYNLFVDEFYHKRWLLMFPSKFKYAFVSMVIKFKYLIIIYNCTLFSFENTLSY